jgi:hypothetical protein
MSQISPENEGPKGKIYRDVSNEAFSLALSGRIERQIAEYIEGLPGYTLDLHYEDLNQLSRAKFYLLRYLGCNNAALRHPIFNVELDRACAKSTDGIERNSIIAAFCVKDGDSTVLLDFREDTHFMYRQRKGRSLQLVKRDAFADPTCLVVQLVSDKFHITPILSLAAFKAGLQRLEEIGRELEKTDPGLCIDPVQSSSFLYSQLARALRKSIVSRNTDRNPLTDEIHDVGRILSMVVNNDSTVTMNVSVVIIPPASKKQGNCAITELEHRNETHTIELGYDCNQGTLNPKSLKNSAI